MCIFIVKTESKIWPIMVITTKYASPAKELNSLTVICSHDAILFPF